MKLNDIKHNHSLTDLLKILIFSILMLAPILSVATRCLYVICNKNAYQSYYGETINEEIYNDITELKSNETYLFDNSSLYNGTIDGTYIIYVDDIKNYSFPAIGTIFQNALDNNEIKDIRLSMYNSKPLINFRDENANNIQNYYLDDNVFTFEFTFLSYNTNPSNTLHFFKAITYNKFSYLDNVFDYSVNELENNELFTWTENTAIFTGIKTMTTQLGINGNVIPILFVYWFILTIIYIIIDIVLKIFTLLTHALGTKTAN